MLHRVISRLETGDPGNELPLMQPQLLDVFPAKLTGYTLLSPNRWYYTFIEQTPDKEGKWKDKVNGRTGQAYNRHEAFNTETGIAGSGDNMSNLPPLLPLGPAIPDVQMWVNCEGELEYHFKEVNNRDICNFE